MGFAIHLQQLRVPYISQEGQPGQPGQPLKVQGAILDFTCQIYDTH
jgi:hypothetical protein